MIEVGYNGGAFLPETGLWLDPKEPRDLAFISHAHSDHTGNHARTILTAGTERLMCVRSEGGDGMKHVLGYDEPADFDNFRITLLPAGHVAGSAMAWIEASGGTLLYTGDFKLRKGLSSEPAQLRHAETLIMETTYGLPKYRFPPAEKVLADITKFCVEALEENHVPVLLGYSLGKSQEILAALTHGGLPIMLHGSVWKLAKAYEEMGAVFPSYEKYAEDTVAGRVLICPPSVQGSRMLSKIRLRRVAMLSGWAMDPSAIHRWHCDAVFPLSDHADYSELLACVEAVKPSRVLTLHGFATEFAADLRARGMEAWALTGADQLELPVVVPVLTPVPVQAAVQVSGQLERTGFGRFCLSCDVIAASTGKLEKTRILSEFFRKLPDNELARAAVWLTGSAFPQCDTEPTHTGWAIIRRALIAASGKTESEFQAISRMHNDAGLTAGQVLAGNAGRRRIEIGDLQALFLRLRSASGPLARIEALREVLADVSATEARYIVKILTGDLRIGLKEGLVEESIAAAFNVPSEEVRSVNMLLGDIGRAAVLARHNRLETAEMALFRPVKCMLAGVEPDAESVWKRLSGEAGEVWIEDKLDGIRAQVHCSAVRAGIFSRDLKSLDAMFPEIADAARTLGRDAIFDGEILAFREGRALPFFELQKRLGRRDADLFLGSQIPVVFATFDLLHLDGQSLLRKPLSLRRKRLEELTLPSGFLIVEIARTKSAQEIDAAFLAARGRGNEGLMAKDPASSYTPGRRGLAWIKLKKQFATLDVVVVAVEYGHGRRNKVLSDYTFAVRDETTGALLPIGKAYSGLTDAEIAGLTAEFLSLEITRRGNRIEVEPRVVLEVAFDSIQASTRHASGLALRFPRINAIRRDKTPAEIDTLASARRLAAIS